MNNQIRSKSSRQWRNTVFFAADVMIALAMTGCGGCGSSSTSDSSTSVTSLTGTLGVSTSSASASRIGFKNMLEANSSQLRKASDFAHQELASRNLDYSGYQIQVIQMSDPPIEEKYSVNADGSFKLTAIPTKGVAINVLDTSDNLVANLTIINPSQTALGGGSSTSDKLNLQDGVSGDLGSVSLDPDIGLAEVTLNTDFQSLLAKSDSVTNPFDFSGTYKMAAYDQAIPKGYIAMCAESASGKHDDNCRGPTVGELVTLVRATGKDFTPDSTCANKVSAGTFSDSDTCSGTTGSTDRFIAMAWQSVAKYEKCGKRLGATFDQAKAFGRIDLTGNPEGLTSGAPVYSTDDGAGVTITDGWKFSNSKSQWSMNDCGALKVTNTVTSEKGDAWVCHDRTNDSYSINLGKGGGCVDAATGATVDAIDWSKVEWSNSDSKYTGSQTSLTNDGWAGFTKWVNYPKYETTTLKCTNIGGNFTKSGDTYTPCPTCTFDYNSVKSVLAKDALCSSLTPTTDQETLAQLMCYANGYWDKAQKASDVCLRKLEANWAATSPSDFLLDDGVKYAQGQHMVSPAVYTADNSVSFHFDEEHFEGVQLQSSSGSSWTPCRVRDTMTLSLVKRDDTTSTVEFNNGTYLISRDPVCLGAADAKGWGTVSKAIGLMVKQ